MDIEKEYNALKPKYNLPSFKFLNENFEILSLDKDKIEKDNLLLQIRRRINEKIVWICNVLQGIVMPNPSSIIGLHEEKFFSKEDKERILKTLQKLMKIEREVLILDIKPNNEKQDASFIKKIEKTWPELIEELTQYSEILQKGWLKTEKEDFHNYFG